MTSIAAALANTLADGGWRAKARPSQLPPDGDWLGWLAMAGRGWGKTFTGSGWVNELVETGTAGRIALVAPTAADARDTMVEGQSGLLRMAPPWNRPIYEPSKRRLTWPNGAIATTFSSEEADRLRGPEHDAAWADELAAWTDPQATWDMLMFGLRLGRHPRWLATTTPRPIKLLKELLAREGRDVVVTRGSTFENEANLAATFLAAVRQRYEGTRLGRQELNAELLSDMPGALWQLDWLDRDRVSVAPKELRRIVVAIDPAVSNNEGSDETGIIVAGVTRDDHVYVLEDLSGRYAPHEWAAKAIDAYRRQKADRILAEVNNGGAMVEATIRAIDSRVSFKAVHASRGKVVRAEPIAALYEQRKVHHVGNFAVLEDQMCSFTSDFDRAKVGYSPDRVDALVWALTELSGSQHTSSSWELRI
ncbi:MULTISPECIES: DNA-packaging protein [unclassified Bradyrhizobium]|uniref:DNA-packaging protein n=1 Tax=Bradyrhizobium sp. USDA 4541 TaxID=2817704 RepID=UPI0020A27249|nr:terminase family protein [Bradyrhizobium sp. USDA 4541]MCP1852097.1 putative phage terminase large subunit-like protein [Bradyrhizobium sp. USDA 4541]